MRRYALALALVAGCKGEPGDGTSADASGEDASYDTRIDTTDAAVVETFIDTSFDTPFDATHESAFDSDVGVDGACIPGCHWDCLSTAGGAVCAGDKVWQEVGRAYRTCCHGEWPGPGPGCTLDAPPYACTAGCAPGTVDPRYAACFPPSRLDTPLELYALLCNEGAPKAVGASCSTDADCRPSATSVRLQCDAASRTCIIAPRPAAPTGYGGSCGVDASTVSPGGEQVIVGTSCPFCYVSYASTSSCVAQACTMPCVFDDDCPSGSVCVCLPSAGVGVDAGPRAAWQVCAAITDRSTESGRTAWLKCP